MVLHRLTQQVVRTRLAETTEDCGVFQAVLASACTGDPGHPDHWPRYAALAEHVIQLDRLSPHGSLDPGKIVGLLNRVALFLRFRPARYTDAVRLLRRAIDIASRRWGDSHRETLASMNELALTLRARGDQGDLGEARELQERVLEGCRQALGESHSNTFKSMGHLASTLYAQGDLGRARALQELALEGCRRESGDSHPDTLTSMNNLALTLRAQGDLVTARKLGEQVLEGRRRVLGESHPDTLASLYNLAMVLNAQGNHSGVQELDELRRRALGELPDLEFRRIRLENWMNFTHADVSIQDRIFLVGPNASGKSNFLDVFRFLKDLASSGGGLQEAIRKRGGVETLRSLATPPTPTVMIRVELEEADQGRRWEYELAFRQGSHGRPLVDRERVRRNGEWLLDRPNQGRSRRFGTPDADLDRAGERQPGISRASGMLRLHPLSACRSPDRPRAGPIIWPGRRSVRR